MGVKDFIQDLMPVRLVNRTDYLYIAVLDEGGNGLMILRPGEWTYPRLFGIDGFAAYLEWEGYMQLVKVYDTRGVGSEVWKLSNRFGNGNNSVRYRNGNYDVDRSGTAWEELETEGDRNYFSPLRKYVNMTLNEMLHDEHIAMHSGPRVGSPLTRLV